MKPLRLLLQKLGDATAVCRRLWISREELEGYLSGSRPVPACVSLHVLDILVGKPTSFH